MLTLFLFILGFVVLVKGADLLVDGASSLAQRLGVSALVIGLTVVSFGTSAPELVVNLSASLSHNTDIAIGNILGSNIANILLILGLSALFYPLTVGSGTVRKEIPFALLAVIVIYLLANDMLIDGATTSVLTRIDGFILISFFALFLYYLFEISRENTTPPESQPTSALSPTRSIIMIVIGLIGLALGGKWIVDGAVVFATNLGVSQAMIGLTIIAIGTSLPELATSVVAAYKKNVDIAIGNIIGSNIFNIFFILGISAIISPLPFAATFTSDLWMTLFATVLLFASLFVGKRRTLERWQGALFVVIYIAYLVSLIVRG